MAEITRKGLILAGGRNSRLYPTTLAVPKSLLPIYDKPLIYYSLSVLFLAGVREILIITTPEGEAAHKRLLGDGEQFGAKFTYQAQDAPRGIADAFLVGRKFIGGAPSALILSDNLYYGGNLVTALREAAAAATGATVFAYPVPDARRFGVVEFDGDGRALSLEEKPQKPKSHYAVTGCYFYDERAAEFAAALRPSARGELEITDLNRVYLENNALSVKRLRRGIAWFDTGTADGLAEASGFVRAIQNQQGLMISCPEEIAWRNGWLDADGLLAQAEQAKNTPYGDYLRRLAADADATGDGESSDFHK